MKVFSRRLKIKVMFDREMIKLNRIVYLLQRSRKVFIVGHVSPDGDAVGSMLALKLALEKKNKEVVLALDDQVPKYLMFLPGSRAIRSLPEVYKMALSAELVVSLDSATYERTGLHNYFVNPSFHPKFINIDHHHDNPEYGTLNYIKADSSSTSEIIYHILPRLAAEINPQVATCLLNGIFFDTGSFQNPNTSIQTLKITSDLLALGASLREVTTNNLKNKSLGTLRLWGKILSRIKRNKKWGIVSTMVTEKDFIETGASSEDMEGISNFLNSIPDANLSMVLSEKGEGMLKGSLRTLKDNIDVSKLAAVFGGGGHPKAAGFTISGKIHETANGFQII